MYTRKDASKIRQEFWTTFGRYMIPVTSASGEKVNWVNYKTGIRDIYFRMDTYSNEAKVQVLIKGNDDARISYYNRLLSMKPFFEDTTGNNWLWYEQLDVNGQTVSLLETTLTGVNIFNKNDWPALISFFKKNITALDQFWLIAKEILE